MSDENVDDVVNNPRKLEKCLHSGTNDAADSSFKKPHARSLHPLLVLVTSVNLRIPIGHCHSERCVRWRRRTRGTWGTVIISCDSGVGNEGRLCLPHKLHRCCTTMKGIRERGKAGISVKVPEPRPNVPACLLDGAELIVKVTLIQINLIRRFSK